MPPAWIMTRVGLPAIAGVALGLLITRPEKIATRGAEAPASRATQREAVLPDDLSTVKVAALAGRGTEARKKVRELLDAGAKDGEITEWLSLVLFSDPAWLDEFIATVPEDRRIALARLAVFKVGQLSADAAWELIRGSPYARQAARSDVEIEHRKGMEILGYCTGSPLAAEVMLDRALGFSNKEIERVLRFSRGGENARRILEEWKSGRWKGDPPGYVEGAWSYFWINDRDAMREMEKTLPDDLRNRTDRFNLLNEQNKNAGEMDTSSVAALSELEPEVLQSLLADQGQSGTRIPLEKLAALPEKLRRIGIENYFEQNDSFHPEMARECVEQLDRLNLTPAEKRSLLEKAAAAIWEEQGDYQAAFDWSTRIPDEKARVASQEKILTELARQDPDAALAYAAALPEGALRDKIEMLAKEAMP